MVDKWGCVIPSSLVPFPFTLFLKYSKLAPFFFSAFMGVLQSSSLQLVAGMLTNAVLAGGRQPKSEKIKLYIYIYIYKTNVVLFCQNLNKSFTVSLDMGGAGLQPCQNLNKSLLSLEWPSHTLLATHFLSSNLKKKPKFQSRSRGWTSLWLLHDQFEQQELRDFSVTLGPNGLFGYAEIKLASRG